MEKVNGMLQTCGCILLEAEDTCPSQFSIDKTDTFLNSFRDTV